VLEAGELLGHHVCDAPEGGAEDHDRRGLGAGGGTGGVGLSGGELDLAELGSGAGDACAPAWPGTVDTPTGGDADGNQCRPADAESDTGGQEVLPLGLVRRPIVGTALDHSQVGPITNAAATNRNQRGWPRQRRLNDTLNTTRRALINTPVATARPASTARRAARWALLPYTSQLPDHGLSSRRGPGDLHAFSTVAPSPAARGSVPSSMYRPHEGRTRGRSRKAPPYGRPITDTGEIQ
jgi:hypothetical protein